ncbi:MAG: TIGR04222 domain-containing membrane protein [Pyrinomonadaceae bacterium]
MDFLLDNPLVTMDAYAFLALYVVTIISTFTIIWIARRESDKTGGLPLPAVPPDPDPFEIAYLRGGSNEAARAVVFSLMQNDMAELRKDGKRTLLQVAPAVGIERATGLERAALEWIGSKREVKELFDRANGLVARLRPHLDIYHDRLTAKNLLTAEAVSGKLKKYARFAAGFLALVGGYRVLTSIVYGHYNIAFTVILTIIAVIAVLSAGSLPRITKLGRLYLDRLQLAFDDLKRTSVQPYLPGSETAVVPQATFAGVDPLLLSVGLFGGGVLAGTVFNDYNTAFQRSQQQAAAGGCGSGCGSGCSSGGDGGSGCGSGCGGGGCGGGCGG